LVRIDSDAMTMLMTASAVKIPGRPGRQSIVLYPSGCTGTGDIGGIGGIDTVGDGACMGGTEGFGDV
jgi:hypothetical protein